MEDATRLVGLDELAVGGSYLFTVVEREGTLEEVTLVRTADCVRAWRNRCQHEREQRLDRGGDIGVVIRDGHLVCPRHGSAFDGCTGACGTGPAAGSVLLEVDVAIANGAVYLTDRAVEFRHVGGLPDDGDGDDDGGPASTSHLRF